LRLRKRAIKQLLKRYKLASLSHALRGELRTARAEQPAYPATTPEKPKAGE